jgi:CBS domain-containing protein
MATVADILAKKGSRVHCVSPVSTVLDAVQLMTRSRIGSLVVTVTGDTPASCDRVVGMFTERDVLTRIVSEQRAPATTTVDEVMTSNVAYCTKETDIDDVGAIMRERRIRHLPVCDQQGGLQGLISIGDLNAWHAQGQATEIHHLTEYIHGRV